MKTIASALLLLAISVLGFSQVDTTGVAYRQYPSDFQKLAYRFKPFMVIQSTLAGELELFSKKRPSSLVLGIEATLLQKEFMDIIGGAAEIDRRSYLNRSITESTNSETMFYLSYGVKFSHYQYQYTYDEDYMGENFISVENYFSQLALNLKAGIQFLAFNKISIDTNLGAGIRYNTKKALDETHTYNAPFTFDAIIRHGIQPTVHLAIGLAN